MSYPEMTPEIRVGNLSAEKRSFELHVNGAALKGSGVILSILLIILDILAVEMDTLRSLENSVQFHKSDGTGAFEVEAVDGCSEPKAEDAALITRRSRYTCRTAIAQLLLY